MNQLAPNDFAEVETAIRAATDAILAEQRPDGHWVYELEADATIPAEYVLLVHYLAETPNLELERKIGVYLRRIQGAHGGWPLYYDGAFDISATVKAYFALKMIGDDIEAPHMARARAKILKRGGAIKTNVFTRIQLALYGQMSWADIPTMPPELILVPRWFPIRRPIKRRVGRLSLLRWTGASNASSRSGRKACAPSQSNDAGSGPRND
jgi:squalene-hopene/tetraprenyl-beta-curcumene cyclase